MDFKFIKYVITYNKKKRSVVKDYLMDIPKEKVLIKKTKRFKCVA